MTDLDLSFYERDAEELKEGKWFSLQYGNIDVRLKEYRQNILLGKMLELVDGEKLDDLPDDEQTLLGKKAFAECFIVAIRQGDKEVTDRDQIAALVSDDRYELLADEIYALVNQRTNFMVKKDE